MVLQQGSAVPVIIPLETRAAMEFLADQKIRRKAGVDKNPYLFADKGLYSIIVIQSVFRSYSRKRVNICYVSKMAY